MTTAKVAAAEAALNHVIDGSILGVGSGSTVNCFIDALGSSGIKLQGAVAASVRSEKRLTANGIELLDLNSTGTLDLYIDGADEVNPALELIKGGGAALTREKIIAGASKKFICIADAGKQVDTLGAFPLPVEVIPMARSLVGRELVKLGCDPEYREGVVTDNGNIILDCFGFQISSPRELEQTVNAIPGVVTVGLFALRAADALIIGRDDGSVENITLRGSE